MRTPSTSQVRLITRTLIFRSDDIIIPASDFALRNSPQKGDPTYAMANYPKEEPHYELAAHLESTDDRTSFDETEDSGAITFKRPSNASTYQLAQSSRDPVGVTDRSSSLVLICELLFRRTSWQFLPRGEATMHSPPVLTPSTP